MKSSIILSLLSIAAPAFASIGSDLVPHPHHRFIRAAAIPKAAPEPNPVGVKQAAAKTPPKPATTASGTKCPTGFKFQTITDNFKGGVSSVWTQDLGSRKDYAVQKNGGIKIRLTEKTDNVVFASKLNWLPGSSFSAVFKPTTVSGIVTPFIFKGGDGSDEVDLELVGGFPTSIQSVVWQKGQRVSFNLDAFKNINTQKAFHNYTVKWETDSVSYFLDGHFVRTMKRPGKAWALDPLKMKWGPWASDSKDWAGSLNWKKNPTADTYVKSITVSGCAK